MKDGSDAGAGYDRGGWEQMEEVTRLLVKHSADPATLPETAENLIYDIKVPTRTTYTQDRPVLAKTEDDRYLAIQGSPL